MCTVIYLIFRLHLVEQHKTFFFLLNVWKCLNATWGEILGCLLMTNFIDSVQIRKK